ncbi:hypothetical protein [Dyadobacter psychrophilus]|uniref:Uncharacterized protein n=1 Tax=Dyadobacter psychrophilus TaxID=651661 RepID=A0A1T5F5I3_9BACT|nr:hypothetical protein [Dyadobacter psychrophilus]SKB91465.1 hypothetical protein SAMN05660293_02812 [Dyadobacter psychrophilus]
MKRLLPIGLLVLLLYNTFGLTFAVLFFDNHYQQSSVSSLGDELRVVKMHLPSLPYSGDLQITEAPQGLIRQNDQFYNPTQVLHQNDTLYVTLKSNQAARDEFVALANAMQIITDPSAKLPEDPYSKAIKLLDNLLKNYVSNVASISFPPASFTDPLPLSMGGRSKNIYSAIFIQLTSPPPELS